MKCSFYLELSILKAPAAEIQNEIRIFFRICCTVCPGRKKSDRPPRSIQFFPLQQRDGLNGIPFVPQKLRNFPAILEHRKIQTNPL